MFLPPPVPTLPAIILLPAPPSPDLPKVAPPTASFLFPGYADSVRPSYPALSQLFRQNMQTLSISPSQHCYPSFLVFTFFFFRCFPLQYALPSLSRRASTPAVGSTLPHGYLCVSLLRCEHPGTLVQLDPPFGAQSFPLMDRPCGVLAPHHPPETNFLSPLQASFFFFSPSSLALVFPFSAPPPYLFF